MDEVAEDYVKPLVRLVLVGAVVVGGLLWLAIKAFR